MLTEPRNRIAVEIRAEAWAHYHGQESTREGIEREWLSIHPENRVLEVDATRRKLKVIDTTQPTNIVTVQPWFVCEACGGRLPGHAGWVRDVVALHEASCRPGAWIQFLAWMEAKTHRLRSVSQKNRGPASRST